jgi:acyl-CoA thioesterase FadM
MHEARIRFLHHLGLEEMNIGGCGLIMGDASIKFKQECFYGDVLKIELAAVDFGRKSFDFIYRLTRESDGLCVCEAKTGMVCFDYLTRKTVSIPVPFIQLAAQPN